MRFQAFLKIYVNAFKSIENMFIASGNNLDRIQLEIEKFWDNNNTQHYIGLNIIVVYDVTGLDMVESYASAAIYDYLFNKRFSTNHKNEYSLLLQLPIEYRETYLQKSKIGPHDSLKTHRLEPIITRLDRNDDRITENYVPLYIAFISHHVNEYNHNAVQNVFNSGYTLDEMMSANGIYWESNEIEHPEGMNIIRIYKVLEDRAIEVWASIAIFNSQNQLLGRGTSRSLYDAMDYITSSYKKHWSPYIPQISWERIEEAKREIDVIVATKNDQNNKSDQSNIVTSESTIPDFNEQIRQAKIAEYGQDIPNPITIPSRKVIIDPPYI